MCCDIMYCGRQEHAALSSGRKMEMDSSIKMFITIYKITWCHIVNSNETHTQRVLPSPKIAPENTPPPKKKERERERKQSSPNFVQKETGIIYSV